MAERSTVTQVVQLGMESTPGTGVAATKKLQSIDFATKIETNVDEFRPSGYKFDTVVAEEREWVSANITGQPTYTEIIYPLSSVIDSAGTPTTILDGSSADTSGRRWIFEINSSAPDTVQTFTVEQGSSVRAHKFTYGLITDFNFNFTRDKISLGGKLIGQLLQDSITLTGGATSVALIPVLASQVSVFLDTTSGGLGTTKLARLFSGQLALASRFNPIWPVDAAQTSFAAHVEVVPKLTFKGILEADAAGMGRLTDLRAGTTYFMRILANGPVIYNSAAPYIATPLTYSLQIDMAVKVRMPEAFQDHEGVYAIPFEWTAVHDATWGKAIHIEVVNKLTAL